ncbi:MAG TPA: DUF4242 domain-containing protein [Longimicrobiales bacterium]
MPKYLIERNVPGAHNMTPEQLREASRTSCGALDRIGPSIQWLESFVTEDKITCIYIAKDEETIREHARLSGFPADHIREIGTIIDPTTAEPRPAAVGA